MVRCTQVQIKSTWSRHYHDLEAGAWEYVVIAVKGPNLTQTKCSNQTAKDATWVKVTESMSPAYLERRLFIFQRRNTHFSFPLFPFSLN